MLIRSSLTYALLLLLCLPLSLQAQSGKQPLRVSTRLVAPFVMQEGDKLTGFSMELWDRLALALNLETKYRVRGSVQELLDDVERKQADIGIAAISITSEREARFDFSQPIFKAGLQIMVPKQEGKSGQVSSFLHLIFAPAALQMLAAMALIALVPAHLVWFVERKKEGGLLGEGEKSYFPGIFKACWWSISVIGAQADEMPRSWLGRLFAIMWMFVGLVFVAYFTAAWTTELTVQQLQGSIKGPEDLPGKRVATTLGSTSAQYLKDAMVNPMEFGKIEDAFEALEQQKVDAIVFDAPVLLYYASHQGKGKVEVIGKPFREEDYGIVLPQESGSRKETINRALLKLREDGSYQKIYDKWFSESTN